MSVIDLLGWFRMGGIAMWLLLALDLLFGAVTALTLGAAVASRFVPGLAFPVRVLAAGVVAAAAVPTVVGLVGWWVACTQVDAAVAAVDPQFVEVIRTQGYFEARISAFAGAGSSALLFVPAALALVIAALPRRAPPEG